MKDLSKNYPILLWQSGKHRFVQIGPASVVMECEDGMDAMLNQYWRPVRSIDEDHFALFLHDMLAIIYGYRSELDKQIEETAKSICDAPSLNGDNSGAA